MEMNLFIKYKFIHLDVNLLILLIIFYVIY